MFHGGGGRTLVQVRRLLDSATVQSCCLECHENTVRNILGTARCSQEQVSAWKPEGDPANLWPQSDMLASLRVGFFRGVDNLDCELRRSTLEFTWNFKKVS